MDQKNLDIAMRIYLEAPPTESVDFTAAYHYWVALKKRKFVIKQ